jgi:hypothetical protein
MKKKNEKKNELRLLLFLNFKSIQMKLITTNQFNTNYLKFSAPEENNIPASKLKFKRIRISYDDHVSMSDLILQSPPKLLSWGLGEQTDMNTNAKTGYTMPIVLFNKDGATQQEQDFVDIINNITEKCKSHLVENRNAIEKFDLDMSDLKRLNPLYWKRNEKGELDKVKGPTLYAKCMYAKKDDSIYTTFVDESLRTDVDPLEYLNKHMYVSFALKVESIFIGNNISLQLKLKEVKFTLKDSTLRSLLDNSIVLTGTKNSPQVVENEMVDAEEVEYLEEEEEEEVEEEEVEEEVMEKVEETPIVESPIKQEVIKPKVSSKVGKTTTRKKKETHAISVN